MRTYYIFIALMVIGLAEGLTIDSPKETIYNSNEIFLNITHNQTLDSLNYSIDQNTDTLACLNCSNFSATLNLSEGAHTINATGNIGNETFRADVFFIIDILPVFDITINDPKNQFYSTNMVKLNISADRQLYRISYVLDNNTTIACLDCSGYNATLNLSDGNYSLIVFGMLENVIKNDTVNFVVNVSQTNTTPINMTPSFALNIISPVSKTYFDEKIKIDILANRTLDMIYAELDGKNWTCSNCSRLNDSIELDEGDYSIKATGILGNVTKMVVTNFSVMEKNETFRNQTPRFSTGFEKLPQMVEAGTISDEELALIIRTYKLNPGIINRLIKTGKLGNESIDAILDSQYTPPGIFRKLLGWMGFRTETYSGLLVERYNLSIETKERLVNREDLPKKDKENIEEEIRSEKEKTSPPGQAKKQKIQNENTIGNDDETNDDRISTPPGQAKKGLDDNSKIPPGQAKKNQ